MKLKLSEVITIAVILCILIWILWPVTGHRHNPELVRKWNCASNVKQLAFGVILYSADHDDRLPFRDSWMDAAEASVSKPGNFAQCPEVKEQDLPGHGYAFNSRLSRQKWEAVEKSDTVPMIYDSINYARNASDPVASLPKPGRHKGSNVIGYADGHAKPLSVGR